MRTTIKILALTCIILLSKISFAGEKDETNKAPNIEISQWLQGEIKTEKGKNLYEGKTLVLEFWATWCGPCRRTIPHMNELVEKFKDNKKVAFVSISDEKKDVVDAFMKKTTMKASIALDNEDKTFAAYGVSSIPTMFIINSKGEVAWSGHPMGFTEEMLSTYLKTGVIKQAQGE